MRGVLQAMRGQPLNLINYIASDTPSSLLPEVLRVATCVHQNGGLINADIGAGARIALSDLIDKIIGGEIPRDSRGEALQMGKEGTEWKFSPATIVKRRADGMYLVKFDDDDDDDATAKYLPRGLINVGGIDGRQVVGAKFALAVLSHIRPCQLLSDATRLFWIWINCPRSSA